MSICAHLTGNMLNLLFAELKVSVVMAGAAHVADVADAAESFLQDLQRCEP